MTTTTVVVFLLLLLLFGCCLHLVVPDVQGDALFDLRNSLKAAPDQLSDWNQDDSGPCIWSKVSCDENGNVISVSMSLMGLTGALSPRIQVLSKLVILDLQGNNNLTGNIPSSLGNLQNLRFLMLSQNNFEGPIPESLSSLPNLSIILLGYNNLSGPIPDRLFQVSELNFTGNRLNCGLINTHPCTSGSGAGQTNVTSQKGPKSPEVYCECIKDASKKSKAGLIIGVTAGVLALLLLGCVILFMWRGRHKSFKRKVFADVAGL